MSDSKKPTVSEIVAREQHAIEKWNRTRAVIPPPLGDIPYLLDLVERAAIEIDVLLQDDYTKHMRRDDVREARELLDELKQ